jgi:hypothetical protein
MDANWRRSVAGPLASLLPEVPIGQTCKACNWMLPTDLAPILAHYTSASHYEKVVGLTPPEQWQVMVPDKELRFNLMTGDIQKGVVYDMYQCSFKCGKRGTYQEVLEHEKTCRYTIYTCEYGCGFADSYENVEQHEARCAFRKPKENGAVSMAAPPPSAAQPQDTQMYVCEFGCGYAGTHGDVSLHEQTCRLKPTMFTCEYGCGFSGTYDVVAAHEQVCSRNPKMLKAQATAAVALPAAAVAPAATDAKPEVAAAPAPPESPGNGNQFYVRAIHAFTKELFQNQQDDEILYFEAGSRLLVIDQDDEGYWWFGQADNNREGWFPVEYVERA